jgi:hypothetical protein
VFEPVVESIISTGLAIGCIYALIGITYNVRCCLNRSFFAALHMSACAKVLGASGDHHALS